MSDTPSTPPPPPDPDEPTQHQQRVETPSVSGVTVNWPAGARLPMPGNAEWALWFSVELLFAIIWAASDRVEADTFVTMTAIVTFAYLISRGIAKASRVLEQ